MRVAVSSILALAVMVGPVWADPISNPIAVFAGLDKILGQTTNFEVKIGEEKTFGRLVIKADVCHTRPITEDPKTVAFVEIQEANSNNTRNKVFSGWMFAESPGLNSLEHPIYDVWLVGCKDPSAPPPPVEKPADPEENPDKPAEPTDDVPLD